MSIIFNDITASLQKIVGTLWNGDGTFSKIPVIRQKSKAFDSEKVGAHKYHLRYNLSVRSIFCKNIPSRVFFSCTLFDQKKKKQYYSFKKMHHYLPNTTIHVFAKCCEWLADSLTCWLNYWLIVWLTDWLTGWHVNWLTCLPTYCSIDWLIGSITDWLFYW